MKVLLKKDICESHKLCTGPIEISQKLLKYASQKKGKKKGKKKKKRGRYPNGYLLKNGQVCESYDV